MQLTQKESGLIKELKGQEQLCIDKYTRHAQCAADGQLKTLLNDLANKERQHLDTLTQIENGPVPQMGGGQQQQKPTFTAVYNMTQTQDKKNDCFICTDLLASEKHASDLYNTCIFEFADEGIRNALNHIQKEEQEHGKQLYDYMSVNGMYS